MEVRGFKEIPRTLRHVVKRHYIVVKSKCGSVVQNFVETQPVSAWNATWWLGDREKCYHCCRQRSKVLPSAPDYALFFVLPIFLYYILNS